jgi:hypothetical protein
MHHSIARRPLNKQPSVYFTALADGAPCFDVLNQKYEQTSKPDCQNMLVETSDERSTIALIEQENEQPEVSR